MIEVGLHTFADWPEAQSRMNQQLKDWECLLLPEHFWLVEGNNPNVAATAIADLIIADTVRYKSWNVVRPLTDQAAIKQAGGSLKQVAYFGLARVMTGDNDGSNRIDSWQLAAEVIGSVRHRLGALFDSSLADSYTGFSMPPIPRRRYQGRHRQA
ncbi:MAG TPA: hypothetical protein VF733_06865 [Candidatus Saccharimonadales bacterium]